MQLGVLFGSQLLGGFGMKLAVLGASVAGSILLNGKKKPVGKLNDLRVSSSSYGRGIAEVFGTMRCTGNMIWSTSFEEEKSFVTQKGKRKTGSLGKKKSKKGKATETYEYFANFAMGICAGPVDTCLRIWADNNLIYDRLNPDNDDLVEQGFSRNDDQGGGKRDLKNPARKKGHDGDSGRFSLRFYNGSETQQVDPFIAKKQGDNAVPFRGMCYIMFEHFALADFGNRIPTITVEVSSVTQRKPIVRVFDNLEPTVDWKYPFDGGAVFDSVRQRFYHKAVTQEGYTYLRVYDLNSFKEIKRIPIAPDSIIPSLPQTLTTVNAQGVQTNRTITTLGQWIGVAANGDLMFGMPPFGNYHPIGWVDPDSLMVKAQFGGSGNLTGGEPNGAIGHALYATPFVMNGSDTKGTPRVVTLVQTVFNDLFFFNDDTHRPEVYLQGGGINSINQLNPGAFGTDNAIVMVDSNMYSLTGTITAGPVNQAQPDFAPTIDNRHLFYQFPTQAQDPDDKVWISGISFASYCAGSRSIAMVGTIQSGSNEFPSGTYVMSADPETSETLWTAKIPASPPTQLGPPTYLGGNKYAWLDTHSGPSDGTNYVTVDYRAETFDIITMAYSQIPKLNAQSGQYYYSGLDAILYMTTDINGPEANWVMVTVDRKVQVPVAVSDICYRVATRVGIPPERINLSGLTNDEEVTGYLIENPTPARQVLEELANVFMFDVAESDNILKFKTRGGPSLVSIPQADLGVVDTDFGGENEYYSETRQQEVELPERVTVSFINPQEDYESGTQHYKRPLKPLSVMGSREQLEITLNMALTPERAKTLAQRILFAAWGERTTHQYTLPRDYLIYEPGDVITVELENGERFVDRLTDVEIGADLSMQVSTVSMIAGNYTMTTSVDPAGGLIVLPRPPIPTMRPGVFDVPYLSDDDVESGGKLIFYWSALAFGDGFRSGALTSQVPNSDDIDDEGVTSFDAVWGTTASLVPPPPYPCELTDDVTKIVLLPAFDFNDTELTYSWESIPPDQWPSEKNMLILGDEVIQFRDVTVDPTTGAATISTLIRGAKGTGAAAFAHKAGDVWVVVTDATTKTAEVFVDELNTDRWYTLQSRSPVPPAATMLTKKLTGATRKPWQVGGPKRTNAGGNATITWQRATRYSGNLVGGIGTVPLNEEIEKYEVFLLKAPYNPYTWNPEDTSTFHLRVENLLTPTVTFTAAQLTAAGLTNTSDLTVVIYQISAVVGRGFPRGVTLRYATIAI
jgi:hypothetical protein